METTRTWITDRPEIEAANKQARIEKAAPALLEALKRYINIPVIPDPGSEKELIDTINMSLAAIAAAEGGGNNANKTDG